MEERRKERAAGAMNRLSEIKSIGRTGSDTVGKAPCMGSQRSDGVRINREQIHHLTSSSRFACLLFFCTLSLLSVIRVRIDRVVRFEGFSIGCAQDFSKNLLTIG